MRGYPSTSPFLKPFGRKLGPPNPSDIIRWFTKQENNILIDKFGNDAPKILPVSTVLSTSIAEFADLTGVTITSYSGDQLLSISGNNIISSGTGFVFDLLLSDGTFIPFLHLKTDVSGNENHILNITDISLGYDINGSSYLQDKGVVERLEELVVNSNFEDGLTGWTLTGSSYVDDGVLYTRGSFPSITQYIDVINGNTYRLEIYILNLGSVSLINVSSGGFGGVTQQINLSLGVNYAEIICTNSVNPLKLIVDSTDSDLDIEYISVIPITPEIIPNTPEGQATLSPIDNDIFIAGGGMMNTTDCLVRLYEVGDVDPAKLFFDLSNVLIWNDRARQDYYDTNNTGDIHTSILKQAELYLTFEAAYKYRLWSKINSNGVFKDIFLYANQLQGENICLAKRYVGVGEIYTTIEDDTLICRNDIIE